MILSSFLERIDESGWEYFWLERWFVVGLITFIVLFPMSCVGRMSNLYWASFLSLIAVLGFIIVVVLYFFFGDTEREGDIALFRMRITMFEVLGILTFAYSCHTNLLPIARYTLISSPRCV